MLETAEISRSTRDGSHTAATPGVGLTVHGDGQLFKRRALRTNGSAACWLVGDLDGVRCYITETNGQINVLMTRDDLYPDP